MNEHAIILNENNIKRYLKQHDADGPDFRTEARNLPDKLERLEAERNKNKVKVYEEFQAERAEIRNKCAAQILDIENRYQNALQNTRQRFANALVYQPDGSARSTMHTLPGSTDEASTRKQLLASIGEHMTANELRPSDSEVLTQNPQWSPLEHEQFGTPEDGMLDLEVSDWRTLLSQNRGTGG